MFLDCVKIRRGRRENYQKGFGICIIKKEFTAKLGRAEQSAKGGVEKLEIVQSERVASAGGRKGGLGEIPPALQILGEICSNFFERTPPR